MIHIETDRFELRTCAGAFSLRAPLLGEVCWSENGWERESPAVAIQRRQRYIEENRQHLRDVLGPDIADGQLVLVGEQPE